MTVRQKCEELIRDWLGSDAAQQSAKRSQLVSDLVSLIEQKQDEPENRHHLNTSTPRGPSAPPATPVRA